jgi:hypothetical protein
MTNRTTLTPTYLSGNGSIVSMGNDGTGMTAIDNTNGMTIPLTTNVVPANPNIDRLVLLVLNTNATGRTVTIRGATYDGGASKQGAGTAGGAYKTVPGFEGGKGDLTFSAMIGTTGIGIYGAFEVARFVQPDNSISLDFSGATGYIAAFFLPRAF